MDGTIQEYVLDMAADTKKEPLRVKQYDTNSRQARITLKMGSEPWTIPFGCQIHINVRKTDGTLADATCTRIDEHTVLTPITEQMTAVTGTQLGELYFLGSDGDIKSQSFPVVVYEAVMDQARMESSDDFQSLQDALRDVKASTDTADIAAQYATEQGNSARDAARQAENAAGSIQAAVDAAAAAKVSETNAKTSETAAAQTQQEVTDYVEAQKAAFVGYSKRESDSKYANALTKTVTGEGGITVEDAWTAPVLGLDVAGKSEQVQTTGAQLLNISELAIGGLTGNNGAEFETQTRVRTGYISVVGGETYKLSGYKPYAVHSAFAYGADKTVIGSWNIDTSVPQNAAYVRISLKKSDEGNFTVDDLAMLKKSLMFNAGSAVLPYEPYTGGAPSPSPDYPQDIISTGTVSTGAQMLNLDRTADQVDTYVTDYKYLNGGLTCVFSVKNYGVRYKVPVKPDTDYVISTSDISTGGYLSISDFLQTVKSGVNVLISRGQSTKSFYSGTATELTFTIYSADENYLTVTAKDIMLNAGDTALPWEPYTGGKPSPSVEYPQVVEVGVAGAQLFYKSLATLQGICAEADITDKRAIKITFARGNGGKYAGFIVDDKINLVGKTLTVSYSGIVLSKSGLTPSVRLYWIDDNGSVLSYVVYVNKSPTTITIEDPQNDAATKLALLLYTDVANAAVVNDYVIYKDIMLNAGEVPLPWEPYRSASASITLTEPLRGIGEYRDRIMCRDGVWGIERYWKSTVLDGNIPYREYNQLTISKEIRANEGIIKIKPINGLFSNLKIVAITWDNDKLGIGCFTSGPVSNPYRSISLRIPVDADAAEYMAANPTEVIYQPYDSPTWEPFPSATQQALNELTTYAGTTHLTITAGGLPAEVTLEYVQDTQKAIEQRDTANRQYTDNQIAAIVAALPTATQAAIVDNQTTKLLQEV